MFEMLMTFLRFMVSGFWDFVACLLILVFFYYITINILLTITNVFMIIFRKENKDDKNEIN